jgi:hypothetical protein
MTRRRLTAKTRDLDPALADQALQDFLAHINQHPDERLQASQLVSQGGDEYWLALDALERKDLGLVERSLTGR